ncbi:3469_t:CDS:2 [Acaulospora colombiana]|uniref:3469_t:CDS:1 n=1 Tax=Acaulospora colombiana TaxID=27376 RepID=A0ACA9L9A9_9GLOM|nr:3469_t:CDS:2 [Acaulospora colombiana]
MPPNNKGGNNQYGGKRAQEEGDDPRADRRPWVLYWDELTLHTTSVRRPSHTEQEAGTALVILASEDPHGRLGARALKERLASNDVQVSRYWPSSTYQDREGSRVLRRSIAMDFTLLGPMRNVPAISRLSVNGNPFSRSTYSPSLSPGLTIKEYIILRMNYIRVARFIWAKVVQNVLDRYAEEQANHKIRYQEESNLPTGGRPEQFYKHPERWAGVPCLIPVTPEVIADLVQQYVPENIFHFCPPDMHHAATSALLQLGNPTLMSDNAWDVFEAILPVVEGRLSTID